MKKQVALLCVIAGLGGGLAATPVAADPGMADTSNVWEDPSAPYVEPSENAWESTFWDAISMTDAYRQGCLNRGYSPIDCQAWSQMYFATIHRALASEYDRTRGRIGVTSVSRPTPTYPPGGTELPEGATERNYTFAPKDPC